jgi:hypothetical protein
MKRHIRDCIDFRAKTPAPKRLLVLALAFALALSLVLLGGIARPVDAQGPALRLPDLRMGPIQDMRIRESPDGRRLLRFSTLLVNMGAGPIELYGQRPDTDTDTMPVTQRIFDNAGGYRDIRTSAIMFFSGDGHDHWHVKGLQRYWLEPLDGSGQARKGAKEGFCVHDVSPYDLTLPRAPERRIYTTNATCGEREDEEALHVEMGLSIGWVDVYAYWLPFQWIDITGLPSGTYRLWTVADPKKQFKESRETNNYTWNKIELKGTKVRLLKEGPVPRYCGDGRYC